MNKMTPPPERDPDDEIRPRFVTPAEKQQMYEDRQRELKRERKAKKLNRIFSAASVAGLITAVVGLSLTITVLLPLREVVPVIVYQKDNGTVTNYIEWKDLPEMVRNDTAINVVWQYVMYRETWSHANAPLAYSVVSAMSSPRVRDQYQDYMDPKNPKSPQVVFGDTNVRIEYVNWTPVCPEAGCAGPPLAYRFWFDRIEVPPGEQPTKPVRYAATVRIERDVPMPVDRMGWRWTYNAPLIQVVDYPGAQRESIAR